MINRSDPTYNDPHSFTKTEFAVQWTSGEIWQLGFDIFGYQAAQQAFDKRNRETGTPDPNSDLGYIERIMSREVVTSYREWTIIADPV